MDVFRFSVCVGCSVSDFLFDMLERVVVVGRKESLQVGATKRVSDAKCEHANAYFFSHLVL